MRIASSPTLRIATGLLLAALLSIVGYQVFRRWISHGPEALLERADDLSWLGGAGQTKLPNLASEQTLLLFSGLLHVPRALVPLHALVRDSIQNANRNPIGGVLPPGSCLTPVHLERATSQFAITEPQQQTADTRPQKELIS